MQAVQNTDKVDEANSMVTEFHEGSGGSTRGKGDMGQGQLPPQAMSSGLVHENLL